MPEGNGSINFERKKFQAIPLYESRESHLENFARTKAFKPALTALFFIMGFKSAETIMEQQPKYDWAEEARIQLKTDKPAEGNKIRRNLVVTDGGKPQVEYIDGQPVPTDTVEVLIDLPSPYDPDGHLTPYGRISLETKLDEVLMVNGIAIDYEPGDTDGPGPISARYGAFEKGDLEVIGKDHKPLDLNTDTILTIKAENLEKQEPSNNS